MELDRGRIGRVARPRTVVAGQQLGGRQTGGGCGGETDTRGWQRNDSARARGTRVCGRDSRAR
jgi:hypothetical protein